MNLFPVCVFGFIGSYQKIFNLQSFLGFVDKLIVLFRQVGVARNQSIGAMEVLPDVVGSLFCTRIDFTKYIDEGNG